LHTEDKKNITFYDHRETMGCAPSSEIAFDLHGQVRSNDDEISRNKAELVRIRKEIMGIKAIYSSETVGTSFDSSHKDSLTEPEKRDPIFDNEAKVECQSEHDGAIRDSISNHLQMDDIYQQRVSFDMSYESAVYNETSRKRNESIELAVHKIYSERASFHMTYEDSQAAKASLNDPPSTSEDHGEDLSSNKLNLSCEVNPLSSATRRSTGTAAENDNEICKVDVTLNDAREDLSVVEETKIQMEEEHQLRKYLSENMSVYVDDDANQDATEPKMDAKYSALVIELTEEPSSGVTDAMIDTVTSISCSLFDGIVSSGSSILGTASQMVGLGSEYKCGEEVSTSHSSAAVESNVGHDDYDKSSSVRSIVLQCGDVVPVIPNGTIREALHYSPRGVSIDMPEALHSKSCNDEVDDMDATTSSRGRAKSAGHVLAERCGGKSRSTSSNPLSKPRSNLGTPVQSPRRSPKGSFVDIAKEALRNDTADEADIHVPMNAAEQLAGVEGEDVSTSTGSVPHMLSKDAVGHQNAKHLSDSRSDIASQDTVTPDPTARARMRPASPMRIQYGDHGPPKENVVKVSSKGPGRTSNHEIEARAMASVGIKAKELYPARDEVDVVIRLKSPRMGTTGVASKWPSRGNVALTGAIRQQAGNVEWTSACE
jgi:hypothetical protein